MKKFLKGSKSKSTVPAAGAAAAAAQPQSAQGHDAESPGYVLKEKDLSKLHKAAWTGDAIKIKQLTKKGDVNPLDKENRTPLHLACSKGHIDVIDVLISLKAKLNMCDNGQRSPLMKAVQGNFHVCVEALLLNKADPNLVDKNGNTALHFACQGGYQDPALHLLENQAMVNAANKNGSTPLHYAVANKHDDLVEILLNEDADVNATDNDNKTPLMWACQTDQIGVVKVLLDRKANIDIKDSKGWTANDHAIMGGFHGCSHLIDEYISSRRPQSVMKSTGGASMFGSTAGSDALGFSIGGPAMDNYDDEDDDMSEGKSGGDSWAASASEADDPPVQPVKKPSKPIKLTKFVNQESDNESVYSQVSARSTASRSRIPRAASKESVRSGASALSAQSNLSSPSKTKIPRLKTAAEKAAEKKQGSAAPTAAPKKRGSKGRMSYEAEEDEDDGVTPRGGDLSATPTPRESVVSPSKTMSDFDDDEDLFPPSDVDEKPKLTLAGNKKPNVSGVLNKLGMSDLEDELEEEEEEEEEDSWMDDAKTKEKDATVKRAAEPPVIKADDVEEGEEGEDEVSEWDSNDDLLPSEGSDTKEPAKQAVAKPTDTGLKPPDNVAAENSDNWDTDDEDDHRDGEEEHGEEEEEEEMEEESDWEKERRASKGSAKSADREKEKEKEKERQRQREEEKKVAKAQELREAEEKLKREREEMARQAGIERQHNEEERRRIEEERKRVEEERRKAEREKKEAEEERRREELEQQREREEKLRREKEKMDEEIAKEREHLEEERRKLEEENALGETRKREELERREKEREEELRKEKERVKMELEKERERIEAERKQVEEEKEIEAHRRQEAEKKAAMEMEEEKKRLEARKQEELQKIEEERQQLEEQKKHEEQQRDEEKKRMEEDRKAYERKMEEEKKKLDEQRKIEEEKREKERQEIKEERKQNQLMMTAEREKWEEEKKKQDEEKKKIDELKKHFEMMRRQQEEEKRKMQIEKEEALEKRKVEEERLKKEEKRIEEERKRQEEMRKTLEDELFKKRNTDDADDEQQSAALQHLEDERERLEQERDHMEQHRRQFEEEQAEEKVQMATLEKSMKDERSKLEESWRELDQRRHEVEQEAAAFKGKTLGVASDRDAADRERKMKAEAEVAAKKEAQAELQAEKERLQEEREVLMNRTQEIEKKSFELEEMKRMMRQRLEEQRQQRQEQRVVGNLQETPVAAYKNSPQEYPVTKRSPQDLKDASSDHALDLYKQNIARRLMDEEERSETASSISHMDGMIEEMEEEMESMRDQMDMSASGPILYSTMGQSLGATAGTDGTFVKMHNTSELGHPTSILTSTHKPLTQSLPQNLLNRNAGNSNKKQQPEWMNILSEGDGLDYTSSEEGSESLIDDAGQNGTLPILASTPIAPLTGIPRDSTDATLDGTTSMQLQQALRELRRRADREKGARLNAENRCKTLQSEKQDLYNKLMAVSEVKSSLDSNLLDMEAKIRSLAHKLDQETEKRSNAELILMKTKEQLIKREQSFTKEVEAKQRAELAARTIQVDLRSAANLIKQLEEERDELRKKASSERNARMLHQDIVQEQEVTQKSLKQESTQFQAARAEAVARLEAADESRKAALSNNDRLKNDLYALKVESERQRAHHRDNQGYLATENKELANKIDELKSDIQVNEEALAHATMAFNVQLAAVRSENAKLHTQLERGDLDKDKLQTELSSSKKLLNATNSEMEKAQLARKDVERELKRKQEEWSRTAEKLNMELSGYRDSSQTSSRKLGNAENKIHRLENELQVANATLRERSNQLAALRRELDKGTIGHHSQDAMLQKEREENAKLTARMELLSGRLVESQGEVTSLRQALDQAKHENKDQNRETATAQDKLNSTLTALQMDNNRARTVWEEKQANMTENMTRLKEELLQSEDNRQLREQELRQVQQELTEALRKVSITEANLDIQKKALDSEARDKDGVRAGARQAQDQVAVMQQERRALETRLDELQNELLQAERGAMATSQQLVSTQQSLQKMSELEERLRHYEGQNAKLEIVVKQLGERSEGLRTDLQESQKIRSGLEALVTNLKTSNLQIEGKLNEEFAARNISEKEAGEHKDLWETEVKSRSRIGIRISQLEKEKARMLTDVEEEKRKMRKLAEVKKNMETKYQGEVDKNQRLEQELNAAKSKMKLMKRKLKEQEGPEMRMNTLQSEFERERINMDSAVATMRRQLEDVNQQLERENLLRLDLEKDNKRLQQEVISSNAAVKNKDKLERSKRKLQEELSHARMAMQQNYVEKGELERYKQEIDAKARSEINEKLEQVNAYLEQQSVARDRLEQIRQSGEEESRREMEDTVTNLKTENAQLRSSIHEMQTQKATLEAEISRYKDLHRHEVETRERLGADLDRTQNRLVDITTRITMDRQKAKHVRASSLDLTPSRSSPRGRASSPAPGPGPTVDPLTEKVRSELDKSIERHLQGATTDFGSSIYAERLGRDPLNNSSMPFSSTLASQPNNYLSVLRKNYFV